MSTLKKSELAAVLAEVEAEMSALLKSEAPVLAKADEESEDSEASAPAAEASAAPGGPEAGGEESAPAEGVSAAPEASDTSAAAPAEGSAPEEAAPAPEAEAVDPAAEAGPVDPQALQAEYAKLSPEELKSHYLAAKAALFASMGGQGAGPEAAMAGPEAGAPAPAAAPAPEMAAPEAAMKAEIKASPGNGGKIQKSESDIKLEELEAQIASLSSALEKVVGTPVRKAVTSLTHVPKTVETTETKALSKAEIKEKVKTAVASGKLSKSEKDRLFSYTLGNVSFDQVKDLLK